MGTHNAILPLRGGSYVELIAPDPSNPDPPLELPFGLAEATGPSLVTWAVGTRDIEAAVKSARQAGYDPGVVVDLARDLPEGKRLSWKLSLRRDLPADGLVPFLIDWGSAPHPSRTSDPVCSIEGFRAEHPNPEAVRQMLRALGVALDVERGPRPRLCATVVGPGGSLELG